MSDSEIFNPDRRVVGEDATSDLIVLDVENIEFTPRPDNLPALESFDPKLPGNDVNVGDRIFFGGWPKAYRDVGFRAMDIFFVYDAVLNVSVTSATEHEFRVKFDRTEWVARLHDDRKPAEYVEDTRLGGHSGAGVFRINPDGTRPEHERCFSPGTPHTFGRPYTSSHFGVAARLDCRRSRVHIYVYTQSRCPNVP